MMEMMEDLGWAFYQTANESWCWLKILPSNHICWQDGVEWRADIHFVKQQLYKLPESSSKEMQHKLAENEEKIKILKNKLEDIKCHIKEVLKETS